MIAGAPPSSSGLGRRPFKAVARVRIPLGLQPAHRVGKHDRSPRTAQQNGLAATQGPVAQLVSAPPCHGGGRGFESRRGRWKTPVLVLQDQDGQVAQLVRASD